MNIGEIMDFCKRQNCRIRFFDNGFQVRIDSAKKRVIIKKEMTEENYETLLMGALNDCKEQLTGGGN